MDNTYNGWANRDTWLVVVWLDNEEVNYLRVRKEHSRLAQLDNEDLLNEIKGFYYRDEINFNNVNLEEIRDYLNEVA